MIRLRSISVNTRIVIPFLLVIIVVAGIGVYTVTRLVAGSVEERLYNQLLDSASAASNAIVEIERQQLAVLRLMVFTEGVPQALVAGDLAALDGWLRPIAANAGVDDFILFDANATGLLRLRRVTAAQYEVLEQEDLSAWMGVQRVLGGETDDFGDKFLDVIPREDSLVFYVSAPITNRDGDIVGGLAVGIRGTNLAVRISEQALSAVALLDDERIMGTTFFAPADTLQVLYADYPTILSELSNTDQTPVRAFELDARNYAVLYAPFRLRNQVVGLVAVGLPSNFIVDRSSTSRNLVGAIFLVLFVLIAIMGLIVSRTITNPIAQLVNVTRSIREGDLSRRVGLRTQDELGELGASFDDMTDQLVSRNRKIQNLYRQQVQETARRDAVLTSITDAVIVQDLKGERLLYNPTAEALIAEVERANQTEYFAQVLRDAQQESQHLSGQQPYSVSQTTIPNIVSFLGKYFNVMATPVVVQQDALIGYVVVFHDITALIESERLKDELMLQLSHELRTPLSAIRGYVELVKLIDGANLSEQTTQFVENAVDGIETLERMINESIVVSQIISNRFHIEIDTFNVTALLSDLFESWKPKAEARGLRITALLPRSLIWMQGDERQLRNVLDHVLRNACSYTLPNGHIQLEAITNTDTIQIIIADTGVGIDEDEIERVFERMYRGRSADAGPTDARGLGLGLYITRHVVEQHHGAVRLVSKVQMGSVVTIDLPLRQPQSLNGLETPISHVNYHS